MGSALDGSKGKNDDETIELLGLEGCSEPVVSFCVVASCSNLHASPKTQVPCFLNWKQARSPDLFLPIGSDMIETKKPNH